jgi:hypothetical protein
VEINKNIEPDGLEEELPFLFAYINDQGDVSWVISDNITVDQKRTFDIVNIVLYNPSYILKGIIFLELMLYSLIKVFSRRQ